MVGECSQEICRSKNNPPRCVFNQVRHHYHKENQSKNGKKRIWIFTYQMPYLRMFFQNTFSANAVRLSLFGIKKIVSFLHDLMGRKRKKKRGALLLTNSARNDEFNHIRTRCINFS